MKSRRGFAIQRLMNAMRQAHADGWFIVFDTLTLADDRLEAFYDNPNALRDYFRDIGRMVLAAEGRKANDSHADCYQDRKSGSAGMPRPISYAVFCLKKKKPTLQELCTTRTCAACSLLSSLLRRQPISSTLFPYTTLFRSVFDTLTLADDRLEAFYDNPNALRDYFRDIGRMVLAAEGRKANDSHADCYQYFCVPEYGTANGRLHFHAVHFMRT